MPFLNFPLLLMKPFANKHVKKILNYFVFMVKWISLSGMNDAKSVLILLNLGLI